MLEPKSEIPGPSTSSEFTLPEIIRRFLTSLPPEEESIEDEEPSSVNKTEEVEKKLFSEYGIEHISDIDDDDDEDWEEDWESDDDEESTESEVDDDEKRDDNTIDQLLLKRNVKKKTKDFSKNKDEDVKILPPEFSLNYYRHPAVVPLFWASLHNYFQELLEEFIISDSWSLDCFQEIAERYQLPLLFRCTYSTKDTPVTEAANHFKFIIRLLFECAKYQWLRPYNRWDKYQYFRPCIKRQIGGLYLIYELYMKQPEPPIGIYPQVFQKINIPLEDGGAVEDFIEIIKGLDKQTKNELDTQTVKDLRLQVAHIFWIFRKKNALEYSTEEYSLDPPTFTLHGIKTNSRLEYTDVLKNARDKLLYITFQGIGNQMFKKLLRASHKLYQNQNQNAKEKVPIEDKKFDINQGEERKFPPEQKSNWTPKDIQDLKSERDLAYIALRLVEVLNFLKPSNPMTPYNLIDNLPPNLNIHRSVKNIIKEYKQEAFGIHLIKESCPSRMAQRKMRRQIKKDPPWIRFLTRNYCSKRGKSCKYKKHSPVPPPPDTDIKVKVQMKDEKYD